MKAMTNTNLLYGTLVLFVRMQLITGLDVELSVEQYPGYDFGIATFKCEAELEPSATVEFYRVDGGQETNLDESTVSGNKYLFFGFGMSDEGNYVCKVHQGGRTWTSSPLFVQYITNPDISYNIPQDGRDLTVGQDFETFCNASGIPTPSITWTKEGSSFRSEGGHLRLTSVTKEDSGKYVCTADNGSGSPDQWQIIVDVVFYPPIITKVEVEKGIGRLALLRCFVDGGRTPSVSFWKQTANGRVQIVHDWNKYVIIKKSLYDEPWDSNKRRWILSIEDLGPNDSGTYYCVAKNKLGEVEKELVLTDALIESS